MTRRVVPIALWLGATLGCWSDGGGASASTPSTERRTIADPRSCEADTPLPAKGTWTSVALPDDLYVETMGAAGGKVFAFGQIRLVGPVALSVELSSKRVQQFDATALASSDPKRRRRSLPEVRCVNGELVLWGSERGRPVAWGTIYNPATGAWRPMSSRGAPASSVSGTDGQRLYVFEPGEDYGISGASYDPATDRWYAIAPGPKLGLASLATPMFVNGELLLWGCRNGRSADCAGARYDPKTDRWKKIQEMPAAIANDVHILDVFPVVLGDAVFVLVHGYQRETRALRLTPDGRWVAAPNVPMVKDVEHMHLVGGKHQGFLWTSTWNSPKAPRYDIRRSRLSPELATTGMPPLPDPGALPGPGPTFADESALLQAPGQLVLFVMSRMNVAKNEARALWFWH